ncbi:MAG: hypothetical protein MUC50_04035 [Myxococcota bacterium]|nr:hypothetical protein [Myxococcota bacterium]
MASSHTGGLGGRAFGSLRYMSLEVADMEKQFAQALLGGELKRRVSPLALGKVQKWLA